MMKRYIIVLLLLQTIINNSCTQNVTAQTSFSMNQYVSECWGEFLKYKKTDHAATMKWITKLVEEGQSCLDKEGIILLTNIAVRYIVQNVEEPDVNLLQKLYLLSNSKYKSLTINKKNEILAYCNVYTTYIFSLKVTNMDYKPKLIIDNMNNILDVCKSLKEKLYVHPSTVNNDLYAYLGNLMKADIHTVAAQAKDTVVKQINNIYPEYLYKCAENMIEEILKQKSLDESEKDRLVCNAFLAASFAAESGNKEAYVLLAKIVNDFFEGVNTSEEDIYNYLYKGCEKGSDDAKCYLSALLLESKNNKESYDWLSTIDVKRLTTTSLYYNTWGRMHENGINVDKNYVKAAECYLKALQWNDDSEEYYENYQRVLAKINIKVSK